jgi:predicted SprT family Zn-dependent metalloprotease
MEALQSPEEAALTNQMSRLVTAYNQRHGTDYRVPAVSFEDHPDQPTTIASADYSRWSVNVSKTWMKKDPCLVAHEAVPHELAHLLVDMRHYGPPETMTLMTREGPKLMAFNGPPPLEDRSDEHGPEWQDMARELGAHPCREGYCRSARPYSKYPLVCDDTRSADLAVQGQTTPSQDQAGL